MTTCSYVTYEGYQLLTKDFTPSFFIFYDFAILRALYNISCGLFVTVQCSSSPDVIVNGEEERLLQLRPR
jgi:hypothetical protein